MDLFYSHRLGLKLTVGVFVCLGILGIILIATGPSGTNKRNADLNKNTPDLPDQDSHGPFERALWPDGLIPYILDSELDENSQQEILTAIKFVEENTCINFIIKEKSDKNWVQFVRNDSICSDSPLGLDISRTGMRKIQIGQNCFNSSIVQRMLGRILGLDYEETRPDRNKFIRYEPGCENFLITNNISMEIPIGDHHEAALNIFFDYSSHMFRRTACLEPLLNGQIKFGSADDQNAGSLGVLDIEKLNAMYNCSGCKSYRFMPSEKVITPLFEDFKPVVGGMEIDGVTPLYICRVYQLGAILIGKVTTSRGHKTCWVEDRGKEHSYESSYEILTNAGGANLVWKRRDLSFIPSNAIPGGRTADRDPIYIGRCRLDYLGGETVVTGSIFPNLQTFKVPFNHMASSCLYNRQEILTCDE